MKKLSVVLMMWFFVLGLNGCGAKSTSTDNLKEVATHAVGNVTIVLLNERREAVLRWHAENAWINKIEGPSFKASGNEVAIESVELVHEGLTIEV